VLALIATLAAPGMAVAQPQDDATDAGMRQLGRAIKARSDGSHLNRLRGLRQLRDPALRPFFERLLQSDDWTIQVHATLGLAEIDGASAITAERVSSLGSNAQEAVIANAIDMDLLDPAETARLLERGDLPERTLLLLVGECLLAGEPFDHAPLIAAAESEDHRTAGLASLMLAQADDSAPLRAFTSRLATLQHRERHAVMFWLLEAMRQYELDAAVSWVEELLGSPDGTDREVLYDATWTLLRLAPERGLEVWHAQLGEDAPEREQVRLGLLLLATAEHIPASSFDALTSESDLVRAMVAAGRAVSAQAPAPSEQLIALIDINHPRTGDWVMAATLELDPDQARAVYLHMMDLADDEGPGRAERIARAAVGTSRLYEIAPEAVLERLQAAEDDSLVQEILLLGLLDTNDARVGTAAAGLRRIGSGRADTLTLLLMARHDRPLGDDDVRQLGLMVRGGGGVAEGLRTQAAWLYLERAVGADATLARVFADFD
jgi:hypothetical protein